MNLFETVKSAVTVKQAAEYYGCNVCLGGADTQAHIFRCTLAEV